MYMHMNIHEYTCMYLYIHISIHIQMLNTRCKLHMCPIVGKKKVNRKKKKRQTPVYIIPARLRHLLVCVRERERECVCVCVCVCARVFVSVVWERENVRVWVCVHVYVCVCILQISEKKCLLEQVIRDSHSPPRRAPKKRAYAFTKKNDWHKNPMTFGTDTQSPKKCYVWVFEICRIPCVNMWDVTHTKIILCESVWDITHVRHCKNKNVCLGVWDMPHILREYVGHDSFK